MISRIMRSTLRRWAMAVTLAIVIAPSIACAALGDDVTSVDADRVHMRGAIRITNSERYAVHEIAAASGTVVREYVAPNGTVFALTWSGPWPPDMRQLLGAYFERFSRAAAAPHTARRPLAIHDGNLVVQFGGRLRAFVGTAYLSDLMPDGVRAAQLR
jgi:hypothetical protein